MNVLSLLWDDPLWIAAIVVTIGLHVAFVVAIRRLARGAADAKKPDESGGPPAP